MHSELRQALQRALGGPLEQVCRKSGTAVNEIWSARSQGLRLFVKSRPDAPALAFETEAWGLRWLEQAKALSLPRVLAYGQDPPFLALEWIESAPPGPAFESQLGQGLAAIHRSAPAHFGLDHNNFIAHLPQCNSPSEDWPTFYWEHRLEPQLRRARRSGCIDATLRRDFDTLATRLSDRCGPAEPAARLHGDLWGGNCITDPQGRPMLIDPAVYGGHREIDLAMMRLFGGFGPRVFSAYQEAWPLAPGWSQRVALYQLYPLLVHVNLFGGGYVDSLRRSLASIL